MKTLLGVTLILMAVASLAGWFLAGPRGAFAGVLAGSGAAIALVILLGRSE